MERVCDGRWIESRIMESDLQPLACGRVAVASEMFQSKGSDGAEMYKIFIPKSLETECI